MLSFVIDLDRCNKCGECVKICCNSEVLETCADGYPRHEYIHKCVSCGHCLAVCPQGAISLDPAARAKPGYSVTPPQALGGPAVDPRQLGLLLGGLRSERFFSGKPVSEGDLKAILDAMIRSPSAGNEQNRSYYVFSTAEKVAGLEADIQAIQLSAGKRFKSPISRSVFGAMMAKHAASVYAEAGRPFDKAEIARRIARDLDSIAEPRPDFFYHKAACAVMVASNAKKPGMHRGFYRSDAAISITHGAILARALGISSCRMGLSEMLINSHPAIKAKYGIPREERIDGIIGFGYSPVEWKSLPPRGPVKLSWN